MSGHDHQRPIVLSAVRDLVHAAQSARAALALDAPERDFYLGVEAAAMEVLHPELVSARPVDWPERESRPFREGYLRTTSSLAAAATAADYPLRLRLPAADGITR